jgi:hypothetical protein
MKANKTRRVKRKDKQKTRKSSKSKTRSKRIYTEQEYNSGDGMLTYVWGPPKWHYLHTMSFNYPVNPTKKIKMEHRKYIMSLQYTLPCRHCRENLQKNLKTLPLTMARLKNRETFSRYIYELHELINKMLGKTSGLSYEDVRERYEHFRARCIEPKSMKKTNASKEKGCTTPLYGTKSKCVLHIVPKTDKCGGSIQIDKRCVHSRE